MRLWDSLNRSGEHDQVTESDLVTPAQSGFESAFKELYRRNAGAVFRSNSRVAMDRADAQDALHDSLTRAFNNYSTVSPAIELFDLANSNRDKLRVHYSAEEAESFGTII